MRHKNPMQSQRMPSWIAKCARLLFKCVVGKERNGEKRLEVINNILPGRRWGNSGTKMKGIGNTPRKTQGDHCHLFAGMQPILLACHKFSFSVIREAFEKMNRQANEMLLDSVTGTIP